MRKIFIGGNPIGVYLLAGQEEIRLTAHLDSETRSEMEIALYRYDGSRCIATVDGEEFALVSRSAVVDLIEAVYAIVLE